MTKIDSSLISDSVKENLEDGPKQKKTRTKKQDIFPDSSNSTDKRTIPLSLPVGNYQAVLSLFVGSVASSIKHNNPSISINKLVAESLQIGEELYYGYINLLNELNRYPSNR